MSEVIDAPVAREGEAATSTDQGSFIWYELMTTDAVAAGTFYSAVVEGWSFGNRVPTEVEYRMILRSDGGNAGGVLGLTDQMREQGARVAWMGYVGVDDVDATIIEVKANGGKILMPAFDIPQGRIAMVADPQGNAFYVMTPIPPEGEEKKVSDVFSPIEPLRVGWNELCTADPVAAHDFYGKLFGWTSDQFMPMGELGEYHFLAHRGTAIGAVFHPRDEGLVAKTPQGWRYYIRVPSISKAAAAITANSGTIDLDPHEVPGGDYIIIGHDPQGAEFALVGKA